MFIYLSVNCLLQRILQCACYSRKVTVNHCTYCVDCYNKTSHAKSAKVLCDLDNFTKIYVDSSWRVGPPMENPLSCSNLNCLVLICNFIIVVLTTTWLKLSRQYSHLLINYKFHNFLQKEKTFHKSESHVIINCSEMDSKFLRNGKSILEILEKGAFELPF